MITISILYPRQTGDFFDFEDYVSRHMPLSVSLLGAHPGYRGVVVSQGDSGVAPNEMSRYVAICHFYFESKDDFLAAFLPHAQLLQSDMQRYTNIVPYIQFNEVVFSDHRIL